MTDSPKLHLPKEPFELRLFTRRLMEESPEDGQMVVGDGRFLAELLWRQWWPELHPRGMDYERLLEVIRSYRSEVRLWVMGERPWDQVIAGLAGRTVRRLPRAETEPASECAA